MCFQGGMRRRANKACKNYSKRKKQWSHKRHPASCVYYVPMLLSTPEQKARTSKPTTGFSRLYRNGVRCLSLDFSSWAHFSYTCNSAAGPSDSSPGPSTRANSNLFSRHSTCRGCKDLSLLKNFQVSDFSSTVVLC